MRPFRPAALLLATALVAAGPVVGAQAAMDQAQRQEIEKVVRDYLMKNPEVILEAVQALKDREKAAEEARVQQVLKQRQPDLVRDPASAVAGNPNGDVTVVEFFDYQCGYCKSVQADVEQLIKQDGKLRFVFKEFPILGPGSVIASKAAIASRAQGKYVEFHNAMMEHRGPLDEPLVLRIAKSVGLDTDKLKADMGKPEVEKIIADNHALAQDLGINGTPAFVIGDELVPGAVKLDQLQDYIEAARKG